MTIRAKFITVIAALLLLVVSLAWLNASTIADWLVTRQLHELGFTDVSVDISSLTSSESHINRLTVAKATLSVEADNISLQYSLSDLLHAHIADINIAALKITARQDKGTSSTIVIPTPHTLLAALPFRHLAIEQASVSLPGSPYGITQLGIKADMTSQQENFRLLANLQSNDRPAFDLRLTASADDALQLILQATGTDTPLINIHATRITEDTNRLTASIQTQFDLARLQPLFNQWLPQYPLPDRFTLFKSKSQLGYDKAQKRLQLDNNIDLQGTGQSLQGPLALNYQNNTVTLNLHKSFQINAYQQHLGTVDIPLVDMSVSEDIPCRLSMADYHWQCGAGRLDAIIPELRYAQYTVQSNPGSIAVQQATGDPHSWQVQMETNLPDIKFTMPDKTVTARRLQTTLAITPSNINAKADLSSIKVPLPDNMLKLDDMHAMIHVAQQRISADANLHAANGQLDIKISAQHDIAQQSGKASISLPVTSLDAQHNIYGTLLHRWPYPIHIEAGKLEAHSSVSWQQKKKFNITQRTVIDLTGINGRYQQYPFHSLNGQLILSGIDPLRISATDGIRVSSVQAAIPVHDIVIKASAMHETGRSLVTDLQHAQAHLLGGQVQLTPTKLDLNRKSNRVELDVHNLDIEELVKLEKEKGLRSTGKLNGKLPFVIDKQGISMSGGHLSAPPPYGVIQYRGNERITALAKNNANVAMLLKALHDFHYNLLEVNLNYAPDGKLLAHLRLQGNNPELEGGRTVKLNINLEENIPTLLHSLQFGDEISRQIEKGIQRHQ